MALFLSACIGFTWWLEVPMVSACLFGEYPYPSKDDYEMK